MSSIGEILKKYSNLLPLACPAVAADKGGAGDLNHLDIELIISNVINKPREFVLAHPEYKLNKFQISNFKFQISRRMRGEPLAYILGEKEFYGLEFKVNKSALIPRPETELMVEEAVNYIRKQKAESKKQNFIFIDVGTGSGCIIVTLAKLLKKKKSDFGYPKSDFIVKNYEFIGIDISRAAIEVARQNAKFHKVDKQIKFIRGNLLTPFLQDIKNKKLEIRNCKLIIAANLPYLTPAQIKNSPSIQHEPKLALAAGRDGLKYYRQLFKQIKTFVKFLSAVALAKEGALNSRIFVICEIDPSQTIKIKKIIKTEFPKIKIYPVESRLKSGAQSAFNRVKKDLKGLNRLVITEIDYNKHLFLKSTRNSRHSYAPFV